MTWKVDGEQRVAFVFAPTVQSPDGKAPLVLAFHGHGGNAARNTGFSWAIQNEWHEAVVVYLQGLPTGDVKPRSGWEEAGLGDRARRAQGRQSRHGIRRQRSGHDAPQVSGRRQPDLRDRFFQRRVHDTHALGCTRKHLFAAFAPVAGGIRDWKPAIPRPLFYIGGSRDPLVKPDTQKATIARARTINSANGNGNPCGTGCCASTRRPPARRCG